MVLKYIFDYFKSSLMILIGSFKSSLRILNMIGYLLSSLLTFKTQNSEYDWSLQI